MLNLTCRASFTLVFPPIRDAGVEGEGNEIKTNEVEVVTPYHTCSLICMERHPVPETMVSIANYLWTK